MPGNTGDDKYSLIQLLENNYINYDIHEKIVASILPKIELIDVL